MTDPKVKPLQKFYKGILLVEIHKHLNKSDKYTKNEVDALLKYLCNVDKSTVHMNLEEIKTLCEWSLVHCGIWGVNVDYPQDEIDKQIQLNF